MSELLSLPDTYSFLDTEVDMKEFTWERMTHLIDTHPPQNTKIKGECGSATFLELERRPSLPRDAKKIIKELKRIFPGKPVTCHLFFGITDRHTTFGIHRDRMHVLYLQVLGKVDWEIHRPRREDAISDTLKPERSKIVENKILEPGMMVWNPMGTFHHSKPIGTRMGLSFGVEGLHV